MGVEYGFFDKLADGVTDAEYREDQAAVVFGAAVPNGLWPLEDSNGQATLSGGGTSVDIAPGTTGFARGFYFKVDENGETVDVDGADTANRIDRIVARLDTAANTFVPFVIRGTAGTVTPPALVRDDTTYDLRMWLATRGTDGSLTLQEDRDWGAVEIHVTTSENQPPSNAGFALEYQSDTNKLIRRDGAGNRRTLLEDTGWVTIPAANSFWTPVGTSLHPSRVRRLNGVVYLQGYWNRNGRWTAHDPDSGVGFLPKGHGFEPDAEVTQTAALHPAHCDVGVTPNGRIAAAWPTEDVAEGSWLRVSMSWPAA